MSRRLSLLMGGMRLFVRPLLGTTQRPATARRGFAISARFLGGPAKGTRCSNMSLGNGAARKIDPPQPMADAAILYFHGGGYVTGSPQTHTRFMSRLALLSGVSAVLPDYRLAPENPAPAAFDDARAAWRALTESGIPAERIVIGGDSAGGGLALALLAHLVSEGIRPCAAFAFSPWTDLSLQSPSLDENAESDVLLPVKRVRDLTGMVLQGGDPTDPRVSPMFADFTGAPPVYLQVSDTEILRDDTLRLAQVMMEAGVEVRVDRWPDAPHVWQMLDGWVPEARDALARVAEFTRAQLMATPPQSGS